MSVQTVGEAGHLSDAGRAQPPLISSSSTLHLPKTLAWSLVLRYIKFAIHSMMQPHAEEETRKRNHAAYIWDAISGAGHETQWLQNEYDDLYDYSVVEVTRSLSDLDVLIVEVFQPLMSEMKRDLIGLVECSAGPAGHATCLWDEFFNTRWLICLVNDFTFERMSHGLDET
ncbi:MAG: hypothetical protein Q9162_000583 [Coniocarpon cinnabarinum]